MEIQAGQRYRHFKGDTVEIMCVAKHSETLEDYIVYNHNGVYWVRSKEMFEETIERDGKTIKRFELLENA
jgi:cyclomaltodextrinase / maltogenic alpha-amylase / neopullulanase